MQAEEITIAEGLKSVGYETICLGKWNTSNRREIIERMPLAQGFDYYFGTLGDNELWSDPFSRKQRTSRGNKGYEYLHSALYRKSD